MTTPARTPSYAFAALRACQMAPGAGPIDFADNLRLVQFEPWMRAPTITDGLDSLTSSEFAQCQWALEWTGLEDVQSDTSQQQFTLVNLALWLAQPSGLRIAAIVNLPSKGKTDGLMRRAWGDHLISHKEYAARRLNAEDLSRSVDLYRAISALPTDGTLLTSLWTLWSALSQRRWALRFLLSWVCVESLFGPENPGETTFQLSQRCALFLRNDPAAQRALFDQTRKGYRARSRVVHGMKLHKFDTTAQNELQLSVELILRESFLRILLGDGLMGTFDSDKRDDYLDGLAFC